MCRIVEQKLYIPNETFLPINGSIGVVVGSIIRHYPFDEVLEAFKAQPQLTYNHFLSFLIEQSTFKVDLNTDQ